MNKSKGAETMMGKRGIAILGLWIAGFWIGESFAADANRGKALYEKSCASCHGADGRGNPALAKVMEGLDIVDKETMQKSDAELLKVIVEGKGKMPPEKNLSKEEQKQLLDYMRSLAKSK